MIQSVLNFPQSRQRFKASNPWSKNHFLKTKFETFLMLTMRPFFLTQIQFPFWKNPMRCDSSFVRLRWANQGLISVISVETDLDRDGIQVLIGPQRETDLHSSKNSRTTTILVRFCFQKPFNSQENVHQWVNMFFKKSFRQDRHGRS